MKDLIQIKHSTDLGLFFIQSISAYVLLYCLMAFVQIIGIAWFFQTLFEGIGLTFKLALVLGIVAGVVFEIGGGFFALIGDNKFSFLHGLVAGLMSTAKYFDVFIGSDEVSIAIQVAAFSLGAFPVVFMLRVSHLLRAKFNSEVITQEMKSILYNVQYEFLKKSVEGLKKELLTPKATTTESDLIRQMILQKAS